MFPMVLVLVVRRGGIEQVVTHITGEGGLCQQLTPVLRDMLAPASRWASMISSGCRTGVEFAAACQTQDRKQRVLPVTW